MYWFKDGRQQMAACLSTETMNCCLVANNGCLGNDNVCISLHLLILNHCAFYFSGCAGLKWDGLVALFLKNLWNCIKYISHYRGHRGREILSASVSISLTLLNPLRNGNVFGHVYFWGVGHCLYDKYRATCSAKQVETMSL